MLVCNLGHIFRELLGKLRLLLTWKFRSDSAAGRLTVVRLYITVDIDVFFLTLGLAGPSVHRPAGVRQVVECVPYKLLGNPLSTQVSTWLQEPLVAIQCSPLRPISAN